MDCTNCSGANDNGAMICRFCGNQLQAPHTPQDEMKALDELEQAAMAGVTKRTAKQQVAFWSAAFIPTSPAARRRAFSDALSRAVVATASSDVGASLSPVMLTRAKALLAQLRLNAAMGDGVTLGDVPMLERALAETEQQTAVAQAGARKRQFVRWLLKSDTLAGLGLALFFVLFFGGGGIFLFILTSVDSGAQEFLSSVSGTYLSGDKKLLLSNGGMTIGNDSIAFDTTNRDMLSFDKGILHFSTPREKAGDGFWGDVEKNCTGSIQKQGDTLLINSAGELAKCARFSGVWKKGAR